MKERRFFFAWGIVLATVTIEVTSDLERWVVLLLLSMSSTVIYFGASGRVDK